MISAAIEQDRLRLHHGVEILKTEVAELEAEFAELEQKTLRAYPLVQKLSRYLGLGAAGKLDWVKFKLNFKQEELDSLKAQSEVLESRNPRQI